MICPVHGRHHAVRSIDLLEVGEVVLGSQVHAPVPVHPVVRGCPGEEDHRFLERRMYLEHRAVLLCEVRKEGGDVAAAKMGAEQHLGQRDVRDLLREGGASKQRSGDVLGDRLGYGAAYQVHPADRLDALLYLVVELEHEPKDVARIDERDDDDVPRIGYLVVEDDLADARSDELGRCAC